jgi:hypothetical protein
LSVLGLNYTFSQTTAGGSRVALKAVDLLPRQLVGVAMSPLIGALGTRLLIPGQEQTTLVGSVLRPSLASKSITVTLQHPGRLRIVEGAGSTQEITVVDVQSGRVTAGLSADQNKLAESILFDGAEYFLFHHGNWGGTRYLGSAFSHPHGAATARYLLFEQSNELTPLEQGTTRYKLFYFNQATRLLEFGQYRTDAGAAGPLVETQIMWHTAGTESFPASIIRLEQGTEVLRAEFSVVGAGSKGPETTFLP